MALDVLPARTGGGSGPPRPNAAPSSGFMRRCEEAARAVLDNPFRVLGLSTETPSRQVEREGTRILPLIAAGLAAPQRPRPAEDVRQALLELRAPLRRALHELLWLSTPAEPQI